MKKGASEVVRIRILFEGRHLLTKYQKFDGLKRCWVLLKSDFETISDFSAHLINTFELQDVCPNGLLLSMDGFVLPSFESTCILKDKDIIRVNKKGGLPMEITRIHDGKFHIEDSEIVKTQPVLPGPKLLAIEGFESEIGGFEVDHEENEHNPDEDVLHLENTERNGISKKKRTQPNKVKLSSSKRKKTRSNSPENHSMFTIGDEDNVHAKQNKSSQKKGCLSREILRGNDGYSDVREVQPSDEVVSGCSERMNKKGGLPTEITRIHDGKFHIEDSEIVEKQPALPGRKLLAIEGFESETGGFEVDHEENERNPDEDVLHLEKTERNGISKKKRKQPNKVKLSSSKRKKTRSNSPENHSVFTIGDEDTVHAKQNKSSQKKGCLSRGNDGYSDVREVQPSDEVVSGCSERDDELLESAPKYEKTSATFDVKKFPSRSARRKKAKREWLRELAKSSKKEEFQICQEEKEIQVKCPEHQQTNQDINMEGDCIIPIVVRPGHIRFEPLDEVLDNRQSQDLVLQQIFACDPPNAQSTFLDDSAHIVETFQWNGITSKKKGQKWGKEKIFSRRREDVEGCNGKHIAEEAEPWNNTTSKKDGTINEKAQNWVNEKTSDCRKNDEQGNKEDIVEEAEPQHDPIDFEKLMPLTFLPKEGDVVAYRLVELSSSWCPEISPFRVGKVSSCDPFSKMLTLLTVPEYPILVGDNVEADALPLVYNEDGSIEVEFESLIDPRIFNHEIPDQLEPMKIAGTGVNGGNLKTVKETALVSCSNGIAEERLPPNKENGTPVAWEEISRALTEKKAQLMQREEDRATKESNPSKTAWSYRALRSSGLGPTVALLRAQTNPL